MRRHAFPVFLLPAATLFLPLVAGAYSVTPSLVTLHASGEGSSGFIHLENKGTKPTAVEIDIQEHHKDLDGKTVAGKSADHDFIIYPAQLVMLPGDEVSVQVRWIGERPPSAEQAYTLTTREVSIPRPAAEETPRDTGVRIDVTVLMNYEVRLYVTPPGAKSRIVVETVINDESAGPPAFGVILANQGTAHASLTTMTLVFTPLDSVGSPAKQFTVPLTAKDIPGVKPHLLAGERRRILIPRPVNLPAGPVRASIRPE